MNILHLATLRTTVNNQIKRGLLLLMMLCVLGVVSIQAQDGALTIIRNNAATAVKNQARTGTCWCFSTTSLIESECLRKGLPAIDLSEMFTVRNIYKEKAQNYIRRQGATRFDEGGLGHDVIHAIAAYGAMPESAYSGLIGQATTHDHSQMVPALKNYLDSLLKLSPVPENWLSGFTTIMDSYIGAPPATFEYNGHNYTPLSFAKEVLKFNADDYAFFTSFTHHPFYQSFIIEVPDNVSNGAYYNIPLTELVNITKTAVQKGYTVMWDADVSNNGWLTSKGYAFSPAADSIPMAKDIDPDIPEKAYTQTYRQSLYEQLITQDDHLMHITGMKKTAKGKYFFVVKNSWSQKAGPFGGYINVSEPYFAINTVTIIVPKAALDKDIKHKVLAVK